MKCIPIICALLTLFNLSGKSVECYTKPFKDCSFIGNNISSVQLIFDDFQVNYTRDACYQVIDNEEIARSVKFLKLSGLKLDRLYYHHNYSLNDVEELGNKFSGVRALDISNNKFGSFQYISNFRDLVFLNASHNEFWDLSFGEMSQLNEMDLSFNIIWGLRSFQSFSKLPELKVIDLRNNQISEMGCKFESNRKLEKLRLQNNRIKIIGCETFELLERSVSIEIPWGNVTWLDMRCMANKLKVSVENDNIIIRSSNTGKEWWRFHKTNVKQVQSAIFGANQLSNPSEILDLFRSAELLVVSGNFIETNPFELNCNPFENLTQLRDLDMSNNNLRKLNVTLLMPTFNRFDRFLVPGYTLNISGNNLENTQEIIRQLHPNIWKLDLSENYVGNIDETTFSRFKELRVLNLKRTNLSNFNINYVRHMKDLKELDISNNSLTNVDFTSLEPIAYPKELRVNWNNLTELKGLNKRTYPGLLKLYIVGNPISCEYISNLDFNNLETINGTTHLYGTKFSLSYCHAKNNLN